MGESRTSRTAVEQTSFCIGIDAYGTPPIPRSNLITMRGNVNPYCRKPDYYDGKCHSVLLQTLLLCEELSIGTAANLITMGGNAKQYCRVSL